MPTTPPRHPTSAGIVPALVVAAYGLLLAAWLLATPPFGGPDETGHYLRALGVAQGALVGAEVPDYTSPDLEPEQLAIVAQEVRRIDVPPGLSPAGFSCYVLEPGRSAACVDDVDVRAGPTTEITNVGTYPPAPYVAPGLAASTAASPEVALGLGRALSALTVLALLAGGVAAVWRPRAGTLALAGVAVAVTPMVLAVGAVLNPSGPEIAAGVALGAAVLRLASEERPPRWVWALVAVAGVTLALSRALGPLWVAGYAGLGVLWRGPRASLALLRRAPLAAALTGGAIALATLAALAFEIAYGPEVVVDAGGLPGSVAEAWPFAREAMTGHAVGVFGYLEVPLPSAVYAAWWGLAIALVVAALVAGSGRQRLALLAVVAAVVTATLALELLVMRHHGFHVQGRHVLVVLVAVPLAAADVLVTQRLRGRAEDGEAAARQAGERAQLPMRAPGIQAGATAWDARPLLRRAVSAALAGLVALLHAVAWLTGARRAAVGSDGPWWFVPVAEWAPATGWLPLMALVVGAGLLLVAAALVAESARATRPLPALPQPVRR